MICWLENSNRSQISRNVSDIKLDGSYNMLKTFKKFIEDVAVFDSKQFFPNSIPRCITQWTDLTCLIQLVR